MSLVDEGSLIKSNLGVKMKFVFILMVALPSLSRAEAMRDFFINCGYGTLAGAALGALTVAVSENPGEKSMNIARGASLGLYAGIGYGLYQSQQPAADQQVHIWLEPMLMDRKAEGALLRWTSLRF